MLLKSVYVVLTLSIIIATGYILRHKNIIKDDGVKLLSTLTVFIAMPATIFISVSGGYTKELFLEVLPTIFIAIINMIFLYLLSILIAALIKVPKHRVGVFSAIFAFTNVVLMGFPIASAVLGSDALKYGSIYFLANTLVFWTIGVGGIKKDARIMSGETTQNIPKKGKLKTFIKDLFTPTIIGFMVSIFFVFTNLKLPDFLYSSIKYTANLATPLAMIYLGAVLYDATRKGLKLGLDTLVLTISKFSIAPLSMILLLRYFNFNNDLNQSFILFSGMSAMNQVSVVSNIYNADKEYAAKNTIVLMVLYPISLMLYSIWSTLI